MTILRTWAPEAARVRVRVEAAGAAQDHEMARDCGGWWWADVPEAGPGADYGFLLGENDAVLPDPRSAWQPHGVHEPSRLVDHGAYDWSDDRWRGVPLAGSVLYEMHVGTFTAEGTFDAAVERLDHLVDLGVDLVEVMPVHAFDGERGWGYDGVSLWAVHDPYGAPDGLKRFVDACHGRGLGVVLDVVYNHLGPSGNYLSRFGPYFTEKHTTPWGPAVNLDDEGSDEVRAWIVENALMWLRDYHVDGLRLDAVHELVDDRATHLLEELGAAVDALAAATGRHLFCVAESDLNDPRVVMPREAGGYGLAASWDDDVHHALHALLTGEDHGYYADFAADPYAAVEAVFTRAYFHDGTWSSFRGRHHGVPVDTARTPGSRFVVCTQNHDQVGNRATGDRTSATCSPGLLMVGAALLLTSPFTPMLFMGEEWGARTPFAFFSSFPDPRLGRVVREGRRSEFAEYDWDPSQVPDPQHPDTHRRSVLDWSEVEREPHAGLLELHRRLIRLRRARPELADPRLDRVAVRHDRAARWLVVSRGPLRVACNLASDRQEVPVDGTPRDVLLASAAGFAYRDGAIALDGESVAVVELAR
ncbi:MAG: malto-oligosyltrehalose trehalohydrolase [Actinomycetes bacterium]